MILDIHPENPQQRLINKVVEHLERDGVIIFPTDTTYSFGCSVNSKKAVQKIYQLKEVDSTKPLTFIANDIQQFQEFSKAIPNSLFKIIRRYTPGPITFIVESSKLIPKVLLSKKKTIGVRIPDNLIARSIADNLGTSLLSSSVPLSGDAFSVGVQDLDPNYEKQNVLVVNGGDLPVMKSTIIDFSAHPPEILREGDLKVEFLEV